MTYFLVICKAFMTMNNYLSSISIFCGSFYSVMAEVCTCQLVLTLLFLNANIHCLFHPGDKLDILKAM